MANSDQVDLLKRGHTLWNKWRTENPSIRPDLSMLNLSNVQISGDSYSITGAGIGGCDLTQCDLRFANFFLSNLSGVSFDDSDLSYASFVGAILINTNLKHGRLFDVDFSGAGFHNTDLTKAHIGRTRFSDTDLSQAMGLQTIRHYSPSSIGIDTIYLSKGKIPDVFLRGAGYQRRLLVSHSRLAKSPLPFILVLLVIRAAIKSSSRKLSLI